MSVNEGAGRGGVGRGSAVCCFVLCFGLLLFSKGISLAVCPCASWNDSTVVFETSFGLDPIVPVIITVAGQSVVDTETLGYAQPVIVSIDATNLPGTIGGSRIVMNATEVCPAVVFAVVFHDSCVVFARRG